MADTEITIQPKFAGEYLLKIGLASHEIDLDNILPPEQILDPVIHQNFPNRERVVLRVESGIPIVHYSAVPEPQTVGHDSIADHHGNVVEPTTLMVRSEHLSNELALVFNFEKALTAHVALSCDVQRCSFVEKRRERDVLVEFYFIRG